MKIKSSFTIMFVLLSAILLAQNKHISLGLRNNGICFGNSADYNGMRLNLWDKKVNKINGLNVSGLSNCKKINGLSIGIVASLDTISNGLKIGGLATYAKRHNGIALSGLFIAGEKYNGIGLAGLSPFADTLNGFFVGLWGVTPWSRYDTIKVINGLAIGGLGVSSSKINGLSIAFLLNTFDKQNGVSISCFNRAEVLHGFQFGLINYAGNNRRLFRWIPFINFNLRKNASS
jgi:hypothetical protein